MRVHVVTRVNLKMDPNFKFTEFRQDMLFNKTAPSVKNQNYENFKWVGLVDSETDDDLFNKLMDTFDYVFPSYNAYMDAVKGHEVLMIRLDSDDVIESDYIERLVGLVNKNFDIQTVIANVGIETDMRNNETIKVKYDYPGPFLGIYEKQVKMGCYGKSHTKFTDNLTYMSDVCDCPLWHRFIHNENFGYPGLSRKYKIG